jgi:aldose 1-epimerase
MAYQITTEQRTSPGGRAVWVIVLSSEDGNGLEVWPEEGFNAISWHVEHGGRQELLYTSPALFDEKRPTRTGNPMLFPFPNRIRDAGYSWAGKEYRLPTSDSNKKNSIHGFVCRLPWRVVAQGTSAGEAWLTGEFQGSKEAPDLATSWPADYRVRLTYRLRGTTMRTETLVENPDDKPLPFGLGFHPYFSLAGFGKEEAVVGVPARQYWPLEENLPAGPPRPVEGTRDLRGGKECGSLQLDDVLTDLDTTTRNPEGLVRFGWVEDWQKRRRLELFGSPCFREVVVFNPVHRQAFCIEPYTCVTDAIHLAERGLDSGWLTLDPGKSWNAVLEYVFSP